ncbi:hypothetical protein BDN72DRAFT_847412 [Pluteus cervinus]|uniref:Uncharacterized protein n=1 Tax=Pluteus cervinus TaxID=181527 RepID=A0ACD3AFK1_9AGAR|nr:hypothetical protein BDN72DRAFT_847412 [Pluteus cervinus]
MASLTDLPTEVLELVYEDLDTRALYLVSQLSRHLHYTALSRLFCRLKLYEDGILKDGVFTITPTKPSSGIDRKTILAAVRSALFIENIHTYHVGVVADIEDAFVDLRGVRGIIKAMKRCTKVELSLLSLANGLATNKSSCSRSSTTVGQTKTIDVEKWRDVLLELLEGALEKGCRDFQLLNGGTLTKVYTGSKGAPISLSELEALESPPEATNAVPSAPLVKEKPEGNWFTRLFSLKPHLRNKSKSTPKLTSPRRLFSNRAICPRPLSDVPQSHLTTCMLRYDLFLQPPFRNWTVHILNNSPRLTSLSIILQPLGPQEWSRLLGAITCPALTELKLRNVDIAYNDLSTFLRRHSANLRILELIPGHGFNSVGRTLEVDAEWAVIPGYWGRDLPPPATEDQFVTPMPMLEKLHTIPAYFVWLMDQPLVVRPPPPPPTPQSSSSYFSTHSVWTQLRSPSPKEAFNPLSLDARFPRLREVNFRTDAEDRILGRKFSYIERAFQVLALYIGSFKTNGLQSQVETLCLSSFDSPTSLKPFFNKHKADVSRQLGRPSPAAEHPRSPARSHFGKDEDAPPPSITSPLSGIRTIRVGIKVYQEFIGDLFAFAKGFPDVEVLEIVGLPAAGLARLKRGYGGALVGSNMWIAGMREECMDFLS